MLRLASIMLAAALLAASAAVAQASDTEWPQRPIRLIVPFPAGASTDIIARIVGQKLSQGLGQQIVIENRAGASGNIGADAIAKAAPDGYTIGLATASTHVVAASLNPNLPYDPIKDFAPVAMLGSQPYVLVVHPALPARNLAELIALAKAKPGTLNYGSAGVASVAHLAGSCARSQPAARRALPSCRRCRRSPRPASPATRRRCGLPSSRRPPRR